MPWKKGQSGNLRGRPRRAGPRQSALARALLALLGRPLSALKVAPSDTAALAIGKILIQKSLTGDASALKSIVAVIGAPSTRESFPGDAEETVPGRTGSKSDLVAQLRRFYGLSPSDPATDGSLGDRGQPPE